MKFDKDIVIAIAICIIIVLGWNPYCRMMGWQPYSAAADAQRAAAAQAQQQPQNPAPASSTATATAAAPNATATAGKTAPVAPAPPKIVLPPIIFGDKDLSLRVDPVSGGVTHVTLNAYRNSARTGKLELDFAAHGNPLGAVKFADPVAWHTVKSGDRVLLRQFLGPKTDGDLTLTQKWEIDGYRIRCIYTVSNSSKNPVSVPAMTVTGGSVGTWQAMAGDKVRIPTHRLDYLTADGDYVDIKADAKETKFLAGGEPLVKWAAVTNKYFCVMMKSASPFRMVRERAFAQLGEKDATPFVSVGAKLDGFVLAPGAEKSFDFDFYCGPKVIHQLDAFEPSAGRVMHLSWGPLDYLARLLLWILIKFHSFTGNYGWSIILLTLLVRILFYPLTARGNASMKKMQNIQPKLKELREKYKDNPQLLNTKMMELYRTEGVNPFGGCLPILLQIPVFFALYATLDGAVELRQASFLWCHDLAAADTVAKINLYFFTLKINPLVLVMTGLMVLQQHMTPMSMDPAQKKMMLLMPFVMLIFFYDLPSGLTLYWTVSNIFSIIQLRLQQRSGNQPPQTATASAAAKHK